VDPLDDDDEDVDPLDDDEDDVDPDELEVDPDAPDDDELEVDPDAPDDDDVLPPELEVDPDDDVLLVEPPEDEEEDDDDSEPDAPDDDVDPPELDPGSVGLIESTGLLPPFAHATITAPKATAPEIQTRDPPRRAFIGGASNTPHPTRYRAGPIPRHLDARETPSSYSSYFYLQDATGVKGAKFAPPAGLAPSMSTSAVSRIALIWA